MKRRAFSLVLLVVAFIIPARLAIADDIGIKRGDTVAVCGDSITEQKDYSVLIEDYLLMCQPAAELRTAQFGWGGETSWGFLARMDNDVLWCKPSVATTCYGMNDGGYGPLAQDRANNYRSCQKAIVEHFKKAGVRLIIVGSPGCVDADTFRKDPAAAAVYNKTLSQLRDIAKQVASDEGVTFANVFDPMMEAMTKAKAKFGKEYHVAGPDGVHPARNGHLIMAYAFLKAMGCDGNIGQITLDLSSGKAEGSEGHKVLSSQNGTVEIESTRYPFCFYGDPASPSSPKGILDFVPFNEQLNRFMLVVKSAGGEKVKVTWGNASKEFSAAQLAKGINLAAEFVDGNPFADQFNKVEQVIRIQQNFETPLHKTLLHEMGNFRRMMPEEGEAFDRILAGAQKKDKALAAASSAAVTAVKHTIKVEVVR